MGQQNVSGKNRVPNRILGRKKKIRQRKGSTNTDIGFSHGIGSCAELIPAVEQSSGAAAARFADCEASSGLAAGDGHSVSGAINDSCSTKMLLQGTAFFLSYTQAQAASHASAHFGSLPKPARLQGPGGDKYTDTGLFWSSLKQNDLLSRTRISNGGRGTLH